MKIQWAYLLVQDEKYDETESLLSKMVRDRTRIHTSESNAIGQVCALLAEKQGN